jgi:hypothetical protein
MWTQAEANMVLDDGNCLRISHPNYPNVDLFVDRFEGGKYRAWFDSEGWASPIGHFRWGEFTVTGFDLILGMGDEAEQVAQEFIDAGAEDGRERDLVGGERKE